MCLDAVTYSVRTKERQPRPASPAISWVPARLVVVTQQVAGLETLSFPRRLLQRHVSDWWLRPMGNMDVFRGRGDGRVWCGKDGARVLRGGVVLNASCESRPC